jgi:hypothetical protein
MRPCLIMAEDMKASLAKWSIATVLDPNERSWLMKLKEVKRTYEIYQPPLYLLGLVLLHLEAFGTAPQYLPPSELASRPYTPPPWQTSALRKLPCAVEFDPDVSGNHEHVAAYNLNDLEYLAKIKINHSTYRLAGPRRSSVISVNSARSINSPPP